MKPRAVTTLLLTGALLVAGCGSSHSTSSPTATSDASTPAASSTPTTSNGSGQLGFEGIPIEQGSDLAPASTTQTGTVDGITCGPTEQLAYHIHAHLAVFVNGSPRALPGGIGIPGSVAQQSPQGPVAQGGDCIYWLHTHAPDGVIHIESPTARIYTLGNFFDEWHQPLSKDQVASATGQIDALVDGKPWSGDPRSIPLTPHAVIQLDIGSPAVAFKSVDWSQTQL